MTRQIPFQKNGLRLVQIGTPSGIQLVRIESALTGNRYQARPIEFDESRHRQFAETKTVTVTNLAEPDDGPGTIPLQSDTLAWDVEGRWVIFLSSQGTAAFPAKVISHGTGPVYSVLEQVVNSSGAFSAKSGASNITAVNVAEIGVVASGSPILNRIVMVTALNAANQSGSIAYTFECPVYARYM
jgi:hypothetical protein